MEKRGGGSVEGLMVLLVQEIIFTCNLGEDDERMKKEVLVVGEWKADKGTGGGDTNTFDDVEILIAKDLPVTGFPHTELIDVSYFLHAVAKVKYFVRFKKVKRYLFLFRLLTEMMI